MTEQPFDPLALWRDMLSKWETGVNEVANRGMGSPEFSRFVNQAMGTSVRMQRGLGDLMGRYLTAMNMPTRADIAALGERLQGIEEQITRLAATVERLGIERANGPAASVGPPRTKLPKAALNGPASNGPAAPAPEPRAMAVAAPAAVVLAAPARKRKLSRPPKRKAKAS